MVEALDRLHPQRPPEWGDVGVRDIAETMHEAGLMAEVLMMAHLQDEEPGALGTASPASRFPAETAPEDYWDDYRSALAGFDEELEEEERGSEAGAPRSLESGSAAAPRARAAPRLLML